MTTAGIIAEYNPFHGGHALLMKELREKKGADRIAVVMSGNYVQRGDAAILSKWARTRQALACGADLVAELPLPWSMAGAEKFALGGTALLSALGADMIGFGSECGDLAKLQQASKALTSPLLHDAMKESLAGGVSFAAARQQAVNTLFGEETAALLREPNNILGIEYLKAAETLHTGLVPVTVRRGGAGHGSELPAGASASSAALRRMIGDGKDIAGYLPQASLSVLKDEIDSGRAPALLSRMERGILAALRKMTREDLSRLPDISEGLENRVYASVRSAGSLEELYLGVKAKRYPLARIRRIVLSAFLGLEGADSEGTPPYLHILGIGSGGLEILRNAKAKNVLPVLTRPADAASMDSHAQHIYRLECRADDLYALCMPKAGPCGMQQTSKIAVLRDGA